MQNIMRKKSNVSSYMILVGPGCFIQLFYLYFGAKFTVVKNCMIIHYAYDVWMPSYKQIPIWTTLCILYFYCTIIKFLTYSYMHVVTPHTKNHTTIVLVCVYVCVWDERIAPAMLVWEVVVINSSAGHFQSLTRGLCWRASGDLQHSGPSAEKLSNGDESRHSRSRKLN